MRNRKYNWTLSILSLLALIACSTSTGWGEPKDWTVTWTDNSTNEVEFVFYQFDETLSPNAWVEVARFPADSETGVANFDATKGDMVGLAAENPAGVSGKATHTIDPKYISIPAMPGFRGAGVIPFN